MEHLLKATRCSSHGLSIYIYTYVCMYIYILEVCPEMMLYFWTNIWHILWIEWNISHYFNNNMFYWFCSMMGYNCIPPKVPLEWDKWW
jgi:hypothetical protein